MAFDRAGFDREVGLRLQRARKERGITQEELARRIGIAAAVLCQHRIRPATRAPGCGVAGGDRAGPIDRGAGPGAAAAAR